MNTKLTLNIDDRVISKAKDYASSRRISLSKLVEEFLKSLSEKPAESQNFGPVTKGLSGMVREKNDINYRETLEDILIAGHVK